VSDALAAWRRAMSAPTDGVSMRRTLEQTLECLDALIGVGGSLADGDLRVLAADVSSAMSAAAHARRIQLVCEARSTSALSGRDRRRWIHLLKASLDSFLHDLPPESAVRVDLACVASTREHRWLQASIAAALPAGAPMTHDSPPPAPGAAALSLLIETALPLLDGACDRTHTEEGPVLRLVAPIEG
jgi:hypothetical protein